MTKWLEDLEYKELKECEECVKSLVKSGKLIDANINAKVIPGGLEANIDFVPQHSVQDIKITINKKCMVCSQVLIITDSCKLCDECFQKSHNYYHEMN